MSILDGTRWRAANAELERAWDLSGPDRAAWLSSLRARNPALADDVEALLDEQAALKSARFLEENPSLQITRTGHPVEATAIPDMPAIPNGTTFGPYQILGRLGHGGMGVVYEADEIESGRRVALKVLAGPRQEAKERERFEREGRLAASVNHPHCVFVFGASEIDGYPVIAMEVMRGTLADRLKTDGAFTPPAAIDVVLQIVAGLQAAAAAGILHRDIKPSNCFLDAHGVVKVGDFGISRSQRPSEETALSTRGRVAATPAYASPEQLRGGSLDMRSDIYSVGATLYELLTGRRPFDGSDLMALLMAVANDTPAAPHVVAPAVPPGLSTIVLRCLAKQPDQRFGDYDALAAALEPYASTASTPATLGRRFIGGAIDFTILSLASVPLAAVWGVHALTLVPLLLMAVFEVAYFAVCETRWAATPGKALCGLVVVQEGGAPARPWPVMVRALAYVMVPALPFAALLLADAAGPDSGQLMIGVGRISAGDPNEPVGRVMASPESLQLHMWGFSLLLSVLLFSTARRRNGYAALHDLASRTRIVERRLRASRPTAAAVTMGPHRDVVARFGPFAVLAGTIPGMPDGWRPGFDERLRRPVWIRELPVGTPPSSAARRTLNRPTRLRWLAGRRDAAQAWDAFEAAPGAPLERAAVNTRSWVEARWWLLDLARECAAQSDDDRPPRRRDRVWVLQRGGAKLLDDPALDALAPSSPETPTASFLLDIVRTVRGPLEHAAPPLRTPIPPWPLGVHAFFDQLAATPAMSAESITHTLDLLAGQRPVVTREWRAWSLAGPLLLPVTWGVAALVVSSAIALTEPPTVDARVAVRLVRELDRADRGATELAARDRDAIELALLTRYRHGLVEAEPFFRTPGDRRLAADLLQRGAPDSTVPAGPASAAVDALVRNAERPQGRLSWWLLGILVGGVSLAAGIMSAAVPALVGAAIFRGGATMRLLGLALVTSNGRSASPLRALARAAVAWAPALLLIGITIVSIAAGDVSITVGNPPQADPSRGADPRITVSSVFEAGFEAGYAARGAARSVSYRLVRWFTPALLAVMLAGAIVAVVRPSRGIPDWLVGTWVVPR